VFNKITTLFKKTNIAFLMSIISGIALVFLAGVITGHLKLQPQPLIRDAFAAVKDLHRNGKSYFFNKPTGHIQPLRFKQTGLVIADTERSQPGVTFLVGLFGNTLGARLYGQDGTLIHEWPFDFFKLAPDEMSFKFDALVHGAALYPNGDFVANFDGRGMVRISACGKVLWRNEARTHHSIFIDENGFIWAPKFTNRYSEKTILSKMFGMDQLGRFNPKTGELLETIDLVDTLVKQNAQGIIKIKTNSPGDMLHTNDVEILSASMADAFPLFEAGDIMLSSRNLNQIWILDAKTHKLKWWQTGPMVGQHDPDFQDDGTITLLDNRVGGSRNADNHFLGDLGGSRILRINPVTREYESIYQTDDKNTFYTPYRGKHQMLENGNILIAATDAGRAFEVTSNGEVVWSYINDWDADEVGWMLDAIRYQPSYSSISEIKCPTK
jgi:hypothetical protein